MIVQRMIVRLDRVLRKSGNRGGMHCGLYGRRRDQDDLPGRFSFSKTLLSGKQSVNDTIKYFKMPMLKERLTIVYLKFEPSYDLIFMDMTFTNDFLQFLDIFSDIIVCLHVVIWNYIVQHIILLKHLQII